MRRTALPVLLIALSSGCSPSLPLDRFPDGIEVERTLHAESSSQRRDGCQLVVVQFTDRSAFRLGEAQAPGPEWRPTPLGDGDGGGYRLGGLDALGGCEVEARSPAPAIDAALNRPGAFYRLERGGAGIAVIVPRERLAAWLRIE